MRRQKRRPMHYSVHSLHDGTIIAAFPVRKPIPKVIKQDKLKIDEDGVCREWADAGKELSNVRNESRTRFQNIIATRLNTRRAIREILSPQLYSLQKDVDSIRNQLGEIKKLLEDRPEVAT